MQEHSDRESSSGGSDRSAGGVARLSAEQQYDIAVRQIAAKSARVKAVSVTVAVVAVAAAALGAYPLHVISTPPPNSAKTETHEAAREGHTGTEETPNPAADGVARTTIAYTTKKSATTLYSSLIATVDGREYALVKESDEACLKLEAEKDFDGNGTLDALVRRITACGGNCCGDTFFFSSYVGDGHFEKSAEFGYAWGDPKIELWNGKWSVLVTSNNEGVNQLEPEEKTERFVLDVGKAILVEESERKPLLAEAELKSSAFDMDRTDERHSITFDLDGDGASDRITGKLWQRWGRILWTVSLANGQVYENSTGCKRIGVLRTSTRGLRDLVCDQDGILRWTGEGYE